VPNRGNSQECLTIAGESEQTGDYARAREALLDALFWLPDGESFASLGGYSFFVRLGVANIALGETLLAEQSFQHAFISTNGDKTKRALIHVERVLAYTESNICTDNAAMYFGNVIEHLYDLTQGHQPDAAQDPLAHPSLRTMSLQGLIDAVRLNQQIRNPIYE